MPFIRVEQFSGLVPRLGPTSLAANQAQVAENIKLMSGELRPWKAELLERNASVANLQTIYKFSGPSGSSPIWLEFDQDVDIVAGPVADVSEFRLYYTSANFPPRKTNWLLASGSGAGVAPFPNAYYQMGVPAPVGAPTLNAAGTGSTPTETRAYVYTYVTEFGVVAEESAPSPATNVTCNSTGDTVTITNFSSPPAGNYNFRYKRIYRSLIGANSVGYQLVAEIPIAQASYADTTAVADLGQSLTSLFYTPPPNDLKGLVAMPNGILAGFTGNQIWFCEPYLPHAWPSTYVLTTEFPIVGLAVFGNSLFVGTTKNPYLITGYTPEAMSQEKLPIVQPCVAKKSIVSDQFGVMYASPNGLVALGQGLMDVITSGLYTRDEWQAINPSSLIAALYNNMYIGFYNVSGTRKAIVIQRTDNPPLATLNVASKGVFVEQTTGAFYVISNADNNIYKLDGNTTNKTYTWKSKKFTLPQQVNFGAMQIHADYSGVPTTTLTVNIYGDGVLRHTTSVTSSEVVRLPGGFKSIDYEIEVTGTVPVRSVTIASTVAELRGV